MPRKKTGEELLEEMGFADEMEDTPDRMTGKIAGSEITEEDISTVSNKIERYTERFISQLSENNEECEKVKNAVDNMDDDLPSIDFREFTYDKDKEIDKIAQKFKDDEEKAWLNVMKVGFDDLGLKTRSEVDIEVADELDKINDRFKCEIDSSGIRRWAKDIKKDKEYDENLTGAALEVSPGAFYSLTMKKNNKCNKITPIQVEDIAPLMAASMKYRDVGAEGGNKIIARLKETGRDKCTVKKMTLADYPKVTENIDISYAANPWSEDVLDENLIKRINTAKKRIKIKK